ncbi:MAG TPA: DUF3187 family protein [Verrucomicrobiae bacterium]|nr:DUF3187 family protein [Verrucomicrobiae bacterium]
MCAREDPEYLGPTELQDTFLPSQLRYQSYPETALVLPKGEWRFNATVDWTAHLAQTDTYLFDGESITSTLKIRHSPISKWEFGLDVPYTARIEGVADEFIEFVETTLNAKVDERYALPRDTYTAYIANPDGIALTMRKDEDFQDITFRAKYQLLERIDHWVDAAVVGTFSLPTGGSSFGGEGVSPGLGLHFQKPLKYINFFLGGAGNYYSKAREQSFKFNNWRGMAYGGGELRPFWWASGIFTYQVYTPFASSNNPLDENAHYYSVMGRLYLGNQVTFEAGIVENVGLIENRNSSDVTFKFSLTAHF